MFSFIKGCLVRKSSSFVEIESGGLGFKISVPLTTLSKIGDVGSEVLLHTCILFREESFQVYGFAKSDERDIFNELIKISGVGPKIAIAILSYLEVDEFVECILRNEVGRLIKLPGIGKKTAERLILELREKVKRYKITESVDYVGEKQVVYQEVIAALNVLGYQESKLKGIVAEVLKNMQQQDLTIENVLRKILRMLNK